MTVKKKYCNCGCLDNLQKEYNTGMTACLISNRPPDKYDMVYVQFWIDASASPWAVYQNRENTGWERR